MGLTWSDERPPSKECSYDHVVTDTPLGRIYIEWKGWKERPAYTCCFEWMPDLDHFCGSSLDETKELVQDGWDKMVDAIRALEGT